MSTPLDIIAEAKRRFTPLYCDDEDLLRDLMCQSLEVCQQKVGVHQWISIDDVKFEAPEDFYNVLSAEDQRGFFVDCDLLPPAAGSDRKLIRLKPQPGLNSGPYRLYYLQKLVDWPDDKPLPDEVVLHIREYLVALINIPNTERARNLALTQGRQVELPAASELEQRLEELKRNMFESHAIPRPSLVMS